MASLLAATLNYYIDNQMKNKDTILSEQFQNPKSWNCFNELSLQIFSAKLNTRLTKFIENILIKYIYIYDK